MTSHASSRMALTGALLVLLGACGDGATPPTGSPAGAGALLTGKAPPSTPGDTVYNTTPPAPVPAPASSIQLTVHVAIGTPGTDTLATTPAVNARVSVLSQTFTRGTGRDTLVVTETLVTSGTTDALGNAYFESLPATTYRIEAAAGQPETRATVQIYPPFSSAVTALLFIRPTP